MSEPTVVGIAGGAGSGKDWLVSHVLQPLGFRGLGFADHFKVELIGKRLISFEDAFVTRPPHVRNILQMRGTEFGRRIYHDDIWVETVFADMQRLAFRWGPDFTRFVLTDCRFENEVRGVQRLGGKVYRINAPARYAANGLTESARAHISEALVRDGTYDHLFDGVIENDFAVQDSTAARFTELLVTQGVIAESVLARPPHAGMTL